jgi:glutamate N-acetyltransferase/amino-acid N-acetyltransferase
VAVDESGLARLSAYMKGTDVRIHVSLNTGSADCTVWGCDLTDGYVRINADYTT